MHEKADQSVPLRLAALDVSKLETEIRVSAATAGWNYTWEIWKSCSQ